MANSLIVCPRVIGEDFIGGPAVAFSCAAQLVSRTVDVPTLNLSVWALINPSPADLAGIEADPDCYVLDLVKLAQGDVSEFVAWLQGRGVTKAQFDTEVATFTFLPEYEYLTAGIALVSAALGGS